MAPLPHSVACQGYTEWRSLLTTNSTTTLPHSQVYAQWVGYHRRKHASYSSIHVSTHALQARFPSNVHQRSVLARVIAVVRVQHVPHIRLPKQGRQAHPQNNYPRPTLQYVLLHRCRNSRHVPVYIVITHAPAHTLHSNNHKHLS